MRTMKLRHPYLLALILTAVMFFPRPSYAIHQLFLGAVAAGLSYGCIQYRNFPVCLTAAAAWIFTLASLGVAGDLTSNDLDSLRTSFGLHVSRKCLHNVVNSAASGVSQNEIATMLQSCSPSSNLR